MKREATLVLIKPDGLSKSLTGNVLNRLSETKLEIAASRCLRVTRQLAQEHYRDLRTKPFYSEAIDYLLGKYHNSKKVLALVYVGAGAIKKVRDLLGATNPEKADPTTIRGQFGRITTKGVYENVMHSSASVKDAEREIKLWFEPGGIIYPLYPTKTIRISEIKKVWS